MRKIGVLGLVGVLAVVLAGCGGGNHDPDVFTAEITSDQPSDGDIAYDSIANSYTVTQGPNTLFFGIDSLRLNQPEFRAFLDFPLDGSTGGDVIPLNATIVSAVVEVSVVSVEFAERIPTLLDLVTYPVGGLAPADFNSPPLTFPSGATASRNFDFFSSDAGIDVAIEVTSLMREAQRRGLPDFQLRFLLDFVQNPAGFVGIDDHPTVTVTAPKLIVRYN
ncbi:MAG: hypothetical protein ACXW4K_11420 [Candidatus Deferrimicrobiaceae bacterium]